MKKFNKFLSIYRGDDYVEWVSENWRFSIHKDDEEKPFWIFVNKDIEDSDSAYFTEKQLQWLKEILEV